MNNKFVYPKIYRKMEEKGFLFGENYLWLADMEWMDREKIESYEYDEDESRDLVPFAITAGGDKWVWILDGKKEEYCVGLCEDGEYVGVYYANNLEDAIIRQIIEYVSDSNFYISEEEKESYQINERELEALIEKWLCSFSNIISDEKLEIIKQFRDMNLKKVSSEFGEWYALITMEEADALISEYLDFDMKDEEFEWFIEQ